MKPGAGAPDAGAADGADVRPAALRSRLVDLGFDEVRFARADEPPGGNLEGWLAAGHQADMQWMERTAPRRLAPELVLPGVRSIVALGVSYWLERTRDPPAGRPRWARYAMHADYHDTFKTALVAAGRALESVYGAGPADYRYYTDTGPVLERGWAARAGVGFVGKNAMLISRSHGNWLLLGAILTRVELPADPPLATPRPATEVGALCGSCTRCLDACPTAAFPAPGVLDSRRCVSYQTIENWGAIPRELRPGIGNRIFGCDICLEVCPWNRFAREGRRLLVAARDEMAAMSLAEILALDRAEFSRRFRGTPVKRLKHDGLLRNACVVAGNSGDRLLLPALLDLAARGSPLVRAHAVWAVRQLTPREEAAALLASIHAAETDPGVLEEWGTA